MCLVDDQKTALEDVKEEEEDEAAPMLEDITEEPEGETVEMVVPSADLALARTEGLILCCDFVNVDTCAPNLWSLPLIIAAWTATSK